MAVIQFRDWTDDFLVDVIRLMSARIQTLQMRKTVAAALEIKRLSNDLLTLRGEVCRRNAASPELQRVGDVLKTELCNDIGRLAKVVD